MSEPPLLDVSGLSVNYGSISATRDVDLTVSSGEAALAYLAYGWYLDGQATAVVGTHTHVQTADARVLPQGTAYLTDVGMTGPHDGVIGVEKAAVIGRFLNALPTRFETASGDPRLHAVVVTADPATGRATAIERISHTADELAGMALAPAARATAP